MAPFLLSSYLIWVIIFFFSYSWFRASWIELKNLYTWVGASWIELNNLYTWVRASWIELNNLYTWVSASWTELNNLYTWVRASWIELKNLYTLIHESWIEMNNYPTRCDLFSLLYFCRQLYMFRVLTPIIRSWYSCNYSFWYWSTWSTNIRSRC